MGPDSEAVLFMTSEAVLFMTSEAVFVHHRRSWLVVVARCALDFEFLHE
jgi:hypothetical protein